MAKYSNAALRDFMRATKALADATRVRVLLALRQRELCVCQLTELFSLAPSTMSKHLSILHQAGLVVARKQGRWMYYRLPDQNAPAFAREAIAWTQRTLQTSPEVADDMRQLDKVLKMDPADLCKRQCRS